MFTRSDPTNAAPIYFPMALLRRTTPEIRLWAHLPQPSAAGMAVTNAPTAAPSPAPQQLREGSVVRQNGVTYRITNGVPVPVTGP
jgi:hypothetical protein